MAPDSGLAAFVQEFGGGGRKAVERAHSDADENQDEQSGSRRKSMRNVGLSRGDEGSPRHSGGREPRSKGSAVDETQASRSAGSLRAAGWEDPGLNRTAETLAATKPGQNIQPAASRLLSGRKERRLCCSCGELVGVVVILCTIVFLLFSLKETPQPVGLIGEGRPRLVREKLAWDLSSSISYQSRISAAKSLTRESQIVELEQVLPHLTTARRQLEKIDQTEEAVYKTLFQTLPTLCAGARSHDPEQAMVNAQALVYHAQGLAAELRAGILDEYDRAIGMLHQVVRAIDLDDDRIRGQMQAHDADREQSGHGNVWRFGFWLARPSPENEEPYIAWESRRRLHGKISREVNAAESILEEKRRPWLGVQLRVMSLVALLPRLGQHENENENEGPLSHDRREMTLKGVERELQQAALHLALHLGVGK